MNQKLLKKNFLFQITNLWKFQINQFFVIKQNNLSYKRVKFIYQVQQSIEDSMDNSSNQQSQFASNACPYLSTIRRHLLDFDFEKVCSISLANNNVYGCLVCGKYFNGKGSKTPAFQHSIEYNHYLFINLNTMQIYCLPDNYEVNDPKLNDIKFNLRPKYDQNDLQKLYKLEPEYSIDGKQYIPGFIGMNNLGQTDYANSIFQILNIIPIFREHMLLTQRFNDDMLEKMSLFYKKVWNNKNFKGVISPHQLFQSISDKSNKIFKIGKITDPSLFIVWMINNLEKLIAKQKSNKFVFLKLFEGQVKTSFIRGIKDSSQYEMIPQKVQNKNFIMLKVQFPQKGIFNKTKNQTHLKDMIQKFLGTKGTPQRDGISYMRVIGFPEYLVLVFKRFTKTQYKIEKDSSQVIYNGSLQLQNKNYKLQAQVCHTGQYQDGKFYSYVSFKDRWFLAEDLDVKQVLKKDMLLGQPYIQIYKRII